MKGAGRLAFAAVLAWAAAILWARPGISDDTTTAKTSPASERVALGKAIFFDTRLSEPRGTSCASCHDPARAFTGDHGSGLGVPAGSRPGVLARRTAPSLLYLRFVPRLRFFSEDDDRDMEPYGGFFWDGRSDSIAELVRQPLLNPREMNNRDVSQIADKLRSAPYAEAFRRAFPGALESPNAPDAPDATVAALGTALEAFLTAPAMSPFSSRYDDYIRGTGALSDAEKRGLALFKDRTRTGCSSCHRLADDSPIPERSMFTDYGYDAVGAPRNAKLRVRDDDAGLCERKDGVNPTDDVRWCASFRTPSLRNVAVRRAFMHNGAFASLREVVRFYATRQTNPDRWYPSGVAFDDTPAAYRGMINTASVPYNRRRGEAPALTDDEIDAIVAFLGTLTDRAR